MEKIQVKFFSGSRLIVVSREIEAWQYEHSLPDVEIVKTEWADVKERDIDGLGQQIVIVATVYYKEIK